jgi:hypothetical protein
MNEQFVNANLVPLVVDLATDIWRLESLVRRNDAEVSASARSLVERLREHLAVHGVELIDPTGSDYDQNSNYEVVYVSSGEGDLFISETLSPGIRLNKRLIARPKVYLAAKGG